MGSSRRQARPPEQRVIAIIDYGMGNLRSVQKALEAVGARAEITADPERVSRATKVILPGVGAFADAIAALRSTGLDQAFQEAVRAGKPCLGVCLGLQLLFEESEEDGLHQGLGLIPGRIVRFDPRPHRDLGGSAKTVGTVPFLAREKGDCPPAFGVLAEPLKIPHMGWNTLQIRRQTPLFQGLPDEPWVYFVHSYYAIPTNPSHITATTNYGMPFTSSVCRENLMACQFHPEKSQATGLTMYANFAAMR